MFAGRVAHLEGWIHYSTSDNQEVATRRDIRDL